MKAETDPVADDEFLIRLVWETRVTDRTPLISPNSFEPRRDEADGISFFRRDCVNDQTDVLRVIAEEKRSHYAVVMIPVSLLRSLGLSVRPDPIAAVPGHVLVPEINSSDYFADKARFTPIKLRLAEAASQHIHRLPGGEIRAE